VSNIKLFYAVVVDLFFIGKITSFAKSVGSKVVFLDSYEHLIEAIDDKMPEAVLVDLNGPLTVAHLDHIKSRYNVKMIGYLPHVQAELKQRAEKVCDRVMTQGEFSNNLVSILG